MKTELKVLWLIAIWLFLGVAISQAQTAKEISNRALDQDLKFQVNDGGTQTDALTIDGATANVTIANDLTISGSTSGLPAASDSQAGTLNFYKTDLHATTFTYSPGTGTSASVNLRLTRIGNVVFCTIKSAALASVTSGSPTVYSSDTAIPADYRPAQTTQMVMRAQNNGTRYVAAMQITTGGIIQIFPTISGGTFSGVSGITDPNGLTPWSVD